MAGFGLFEILYILAGLAAIAIAGATGSAFYLYFVKKKRW